MGQIRILEVEIEAFIDLFEKAQKEKPLQEEENFTRQRTGNISSQFQ